MVKDSWTKTKNYRLPQRTLDQLDYLTTDGGLRNSTEAIIIAVDRLYMQEKFGTDVLEKINNVAEFVVKHPQFMERTSVDMDDPQKKEEFEELLKEKIKEKSDKK